MKRLILAILLTACMAGGAWGAITDVMTRQEFRATDPASQNPGGVLLTGLQTVVRGGLGFLGVSPSPESRTIGLALYNSSGADGVGIRLGPGSTGYPLEFTELDTGVAWGDVLGRIFPATGWLDWTGTLTATALRASTEVVTGHTTGDTASYEGNVTLGNAATDTVEFNGGILDGDGDVGTSGQLLTSGGAGADTNWVSSTSLSITEADTLATVTARGATTNTATSFTDDVTLGNSTGDAILVDGRLGSTNNVLAPVTTVEDFGDADRPWDHIMANTLRGIELDTDINPVLGGGSAMAVFCSMEFSQIAAGHPIISVSPDTYTIGTSGGELGTLWVNTLDDGDGTVTTDAAHTITGAIEGDSSFRVDNGTNGTPTITLGAGDGYLEDSLENDGAVDLAAGTITVAAGTDDVVAADNLTVGGEIDANGTGQHSFSGNVSSEGTLRALAAATIARYATVAADAPNIIFRRSRGVNPADAAVQSGDYTGQFIFQGHDGTNAISSARVRGEVDAAVSTGVVPQALVFATGTGSTPTERMRISSSGALTFGASTTIPLDALAAGVDGDILIYDSGSGGWTLLPAGGEGSVLTMTGGLPAWVGP